MNRTILISIALFMLSIFSSRGQNITISVKQSKIPCTYNVVIENNEDSVIWCKLYPTVYYANSWVELDELESKLLSIKQAYPHKRILAHTRDVCQITFPMEILQEEINRKKGIAPYKNSSRIRRKRISKSLRNIKKKIRLKGWYNNHVVMYEFNIETPTFR